jgi:hypothetical protein
MAHSLQSFDLSGFSITSDAPPLGTITPTHLNASPHAFDRRSLADRALYNISGISDRKPPGSHRVGCLFVARAFAPVTRHLSGFAPRDLRSQHRAYQWLLWSKGWAHTSVLELRKGEAFILRDFEEAGDLVV